MPSDPHEFLREMRSNLNLVQAECDRVFAALNKSVKDDKCRDMLEEVHESLANIVNTMKANLVNLS